MKNKHYALLGMASPLLFWTTYFIMANQRSEYTFMTKAVSELGSLDAPNLWFWNFFGYILPGLFITIFSIGVYKSVASPNAGKWPLFGLALSGIFMILSGIFPGDYEQRTSLTMILHGVGSIGSYVFFLIAAFTYPKYLKADHYWKNKIWPGLVFTWLTILFGTWPFIFSDIPAVGQRIVFMLYFMWIIYYAIKLYKKHQEAKNIDPVVTHIPS